MSTHTSGDSHLLRLICQKDKLNCTADIKIFGFMSLSLQL